MSIDDAILDKLLDAGLLREVPLIDPTYARTRHILAASELMSWIDGSHPSGANPRFVDELQADLDRFIGGQPVTVGGPKHRNAHMKPLVRARDKKRFGTHEVWEVRSFEYEPQIRVFGRFARHNTFIATHWELRDILGDFASLMWGREIRRCKHVWSNLFGAREPHSGVKVHDYISDPVLDLCAP